MNEYYNPIGLEGLGSDMGWCDRIRGRKKCNLCFRFAELNTWTTNWHWFYLIEWSLYSFRGWSEYSHFKRYKGYIKNIKPKKYRNTGIHDYELKAILKRGCKRNKKCVCMNVVQRAFWYCPDCHKVINALANLRRQHPHDIMLTERDELKAEILILRLSGSINF